MRRKLSGGSAKRLIVFTQPQIDWLEVEAERRNKRSRDQGEGSISVSHVVRDAVVMYQAFYEALEGYVEETRKTDVARVAEEKPGK